MPRHPPCALKNLATDARVHCAVLKQRPATRHTLPKQTFTGAGIAKVQTTRSAPSDTQQRARPTQTPRCVPRRSSTNVRRLNATLPRLVGTRFQVLFHSAPAVLFTIPSRYYPLSVTREYFGLTGGPARFTQDFSGPMLLGKRTSKLTMFQLRGSYPLRRAFRIPFAYTANF